jgi:hypothetical protein
MQLVGPSKVPAGGTLPVICDRTADGSGCWRLGDGDTSRPRNGDAGSRRILDGAAQQISTTSQPRNRKAAQKGRPEEGSSPRPGSLTFPLGGVESRPPLLWQAARRFQRSVIALRASRRYWGYLRSRLASA